MTLARSTGDRLRGLANDLRSVAFAFDQHPRKHRETEVLINRTEALAAEVRAVVRGRG